MAGKEVGPGLPVFVPDKEQGWIRGTCDSVDGDKTSVTLDDGGKWEGAVKDIVPSPAECNCDDMVMIKDISHESAMTECLRLRYINEDQMYTYVGTGVLIATNPFQPLKCNRPQEVPNYRGRDATEMPPHVYILADQAYRAVTQEFVDQAFIVSGESGAGKTESCKLVLSFLSLANAKFLSDGTIVKTQGGEAAMAEKLMDQIMASNPVLEAFGNAKTLRNNNSSRFGKFLQMNYHQGSLAGAKMNNYLLEKSRITWQGPQERNYHIFYQMLAGATPQEHKDFQLNNRKAEDWGCLSMSGCTSVPGMDDKFEWGETQKSMTDIGIEDGDKTAVNKCLAAILHLGDMKFKAVGEDKREVADKSNLETIGSLLKISGENLEHALCYRHQIIAGQEYIKPNDETLCMDSRDVIAKAIYDRIFDWLFEKLNYLLAPPPAGGKIECFFGVLDIFGFEIFKKNSFEQLCINFTNEKLQQIFVQRVFQGEQAEYTAEGIPWTPIDYSDNKPCCDLVEMPKTGVLAMLDEEGTVPKGSDQSWVDKMKDKHGKNPFYQIDKKNKEFFIIVHYAGPVVYNSAGFMEKNKDAIHPDIVAMLAKAEEPFVAALFKPDWDIIEAERAAAAAGDKKKSKGKATSGLKFKTDLNSLGDILVVTPAWYVRCIKPNQAKKPRQWSGMEVCRQLQYNNVLETIRVRKLGFLYRRPYAFFIKRFWLCAQGVPMEFHPTKLSGDERDFCRRMIDKTPLPDSIDKEKMIVCGKTKVFIKTAVEVDEFERIRKEVLAKKVFKVQVAYKRYYWEKRYKAMRKASFFLQAYLREAIERQKLVEKHENICILQKFARRAKIRIDLRSLILGCGLIFGSGLRGPFRRQFLQNRSAAATMKQKQTRSAYIFRKECARRLQAYAKTNFVQRLRASLLLQSSWRRAVEVNRYAVTPIAAKTVISFIARNILNERRLDWIAAAITVQCNLRRHLFFPVYQEARTACIRAQAAHHQFFAREYHCEKRLAAIEAEAQAKRTVHRRRLNDQRNAMTPLQSQLRMQLGRNQHGIQINAAAVLEAVFFENLETEDIKNTKEALNFATGRGRSEKIVELFKKPVEDSVVDGLGNHIP